MELRDSADADDQPDRRIPESSAKSERAEDSCPRAEAEQRSRSEYSGELQDLERSERLVRLQRAGLPSISPEEAAAYIEAHRVERPWLKPVRGSHPEIQQIFAALDQGGGHSHIRHGSWVTEEMNARRAAYLEDPAQLDPAKQALAIDGLWSPERRHRCPEIASRITDPDVFAAAFTRGIEHPRVKAALEYPFIAGQAPRPVSLSLSGLLGADGHRFCTGWRLEPVDGSIQVARQQRASWITARAEGRTPDVPEPKARPVGSFEGGTMLFAFEPKEACDGYEMLSMYPRPQRSDQ